MTHYDFENSVFYTPILSNTVLGETCLRDISDLAKGQRVKHKLYGEELEATPVGGGR